MAVFSAPIAVVEQLSVSMTFAGPDPAVCGNTDQVLDQRSRALTEVVQFHQAMAEYGGCSAPLPAPAALPLGQVRQSNTCY